MLASLISPWLNSSFNHQASQEVRKYGFQQQQECGDVKSAAISWNALACSCNTQKLLGFCTQRDNTVFLLWNCWIRHGSNTVCFSPGGESETITTSSWCSGRRNRNRCVYIHIYTQIYIYTVILGVSAHKNTKLCSC